MKKSEVLLALLNSSDPKEAKKMEKYMKNNFEFLGIPATKRETITKPFLKESKNKPLNMNFVKDCFKKKYREYQYLGIDYLKVHSKELKDSNLLDLKELVVTKSWWDSVDLLVRIIGELVLRYPDLHQEMEKWGNSDNPWIVRVSINYQLKAKDKTNTKVLESNIKKNLNKSDYFINKAIGCALREYSKVDKEFVERILTKYSSGLDNLSIREASKYL